MPSLWASQRLAVARTVVSCDVSGVLTAWGPSYFAKSAP
ncbi:hypothetical protein DSD19_18970 [Rhodovulum sp. BSW8]|nr:hypothetical protein DSD19_18970 [Rhodovulum sp. BSW8]